MKMKIYPHIHNAEELGIAVLGNQFANIVPHKITIDRAEYGRKLAELDGGTFTANGYIVPKNQNIHETYREVLVYG
jgi:hypothetical protein